MTAGVPERWPDVCGVVERDIVVGVGDGGCGDGTVLERANRAGRRTHVGQSFVGGGAINVRPIEHLQDVRPTCDDLALKPHCVTVSERVAGDGARVGGAVGQLDLVRGRDAVSAGGGGRTSPDVEAGEDDVRGRQRIEMQVAPEVHRRQLSREVDPGKRVRRRQHPPARQACGSVEPRRVIHRVRAGLGREL